MTLSDLCWRRRKSGLEIGYKKRDKIRLRVIRATIHMIKQRLCTKK